jgi:hypothetical protein
MKRNESNLDRIIRVVLAVVIAAAGLYFQSWLGLLAIVPLATAFIGFCPVYALFGINTCPVNQRG